MFYKNIAIWYYWLWYNYQN